MLTSMISPVSDLLIWMLMSNYLFSVMVCGVSGKLAAHKHVQVFQSHTKQVLQPGNEWAMSLPSYMPSDCTESPTR
jgi:hypothetical protein